MYSYQSCLHLNMAEIPSNKTHFRFIQNTGDHIELIPLNRILVTKRIMDAAKNTGSSFANFNGLGLKMYPGEHVFPLVRMESIGVAIKSDVALPPVVLKKLYTPYYEIIYGRHRFAISLAHGYTNIPAIMQ